MVVDLSDKTYHQRRLASRLRRQQAMTRQQAMAVDRGALRVKSEEGLEVGTQEDPTGSEIVYGTLTIKGVLNGDGTYNWTGTLNQAGSTFLRGPVAITGEDGTLTVDAETLLQGALELLATLTVKADGGITVEGEHPITLSQVAGLAMLALGAKGRIWSGGDGVTIAHPAGGAMNIYSGGIDLLPGPAGNINGALPPLPAGMAAQYMVKGADNNWYVTAGTGGGGDGIPGPAAGEYMWPFDPSTTDPALGMYGMRVNPVTGIYTMHNGRDFSVPGGSNIPAIGAGTVVEESTGDARGNRIRIDHGDGLFSEYFHMQSASPLSVGDTVTIGQTIGQVGTTGNSTGPHLHLQIEQGGGWVDPTLFFEAQG